MSKDPYPGHAEFGLELLGQTSSWGGLKGKVKVHLRSIGTDEFWSRKDFRRWYGRPLCGDPYANRVLAVPTVFTFEPCKRCQKAFKKHPAFLLAEMVQ